MLCKVQLHSIFACILAVAVISEQKCMPDWWLSNSMFGKTSFSGTGLREIRGKYGIDYKNQREILLTSKDVGSTTIEIADYTKNKSYLIDSLFACTSRPIESVLSPVRLCTDSFKPIYSLLMGDKMVDVYEIEQAFMGQTVKTTISVYRNTFLPVMEIMDHSSNEAQMSAYQFGNVDFGTFETAAGKILEVPSVCNQ